MGRLCQTSFKFAPLLIPSFTLPPSLPPMNILYVPYSIHYTIFSPISFHRLHFLAAVRHLPLSAQTTKHIRTQNVHKGHRKVFWIYLLLCSSSSVSLTVFEEVNINVIYVLLCFLLLKSFSCIQIVINLKRTY